MDLLWKYFFSVVNLIGVNSILISGFLNLQHDSNNPIYFIAIIFGWIPMIMGEYSPFRMSDVIGIVISIPIALIFDLLKNATYVNLFGTKNDLPKD